MTLGGSGLGRPTSHPGLCPPPGLPAVEVQGAGRRRGPRAQRVHGHPHRPPVPNRGSPGEGGAGLGVAAHAGVPGPASETGTLPSVQSQRLQQGVRARPGPTGVQRWGPRPCPGLPSLGRVPSAQRPARGLPCLHPPSFLCRDAVTGVAGSGVGVGLEAARRWGRGWEVAVGAPQGHATIAA